MNLLLMKMEYDFLNRSKGKIMKEYFEHRIEAREKANIMNAPTREDAEAVEFEYAKAQSSDPLAMLRAEALLVLGHDPYYKGEISAYVANDPQLSMQLEAILGRCLLRYLNQRARAN